MYMLRLDVMLYDAVPAIVSCDAMRNNIQGRRHDMRHVQRTRYGLMPRLTAATRAAVPVASSTLLM